MASIIGTNLAGTGRGLVVSLATFFGCFFAGALASRTPFLAVLIIGAIFCLLVYGIAPQWMVWIALFSAFATMPAGVPGGKLVGGTVIYVFEVLTFLAIAYLLLARRNRIALSALPGIYLASILVPLITGILNGNERRWIILEAKPLVMLAAGFALAELIVRLNLTHQAIRAASVVLWFSTMMILASSLFGLRTRAVAGTVSGADGAKIDGGEIKRYFTESQAPAFAVVCFLVAISILAHIPFKMWLVVGAPAAIITFFTFTRFSIGGFVAAALVAGLTSLNKSTVLRIAKLLGIALISVVFLAILFQLSSNDGAGGWLNQQFEAYATRVFGGFTLFIEGGDTSYGARQAENVNLWIAIRDAPILGHGFGYAYQLPRGRIDSWSATTGPYYAHNLYLWLLVKTGVVGLAAFLLLALVPLIRAFRSQNSAARASAITAAIMLAVSVVAPSAESELGGLVLGMALGAAMAFSTQYPAGLAGRSVVRPLPAAVT